VDSISFNPARPGIDDQQGWHDIVGAKFRVVFEATDLDLRIVGVSG